MPFIPTNWSEITVAQDILQVANANSGGFFWTGILYMVTIILMVIFIPFGFEAALLTSGFIGMTIGIILLYSNLISWQWFLPLPGMILFTILYIVWSSRQDTY